VDLKAIAETTVELWDECDKAYTKKYQQTAKPAEIVPMFEQSCKIYMTNLIGEQRKGVPTSQETEEEEKPTDKQIQFARDLGCTNPASYNKATLSKWIEDHV